MRKKIFSLLVIILTIIIPITIAKASSKIVSNDIDISLKEYLGENYKERIRKNSTSAKNIEKIESMFSKEEVDFNVNKYPNYIGGLYIDDQDDNIVIQIVRKNIPSATKSMNEYNLYSDILSIDKNAKIKYVDYSYNEISEVIEFLADYYSNNYENGYIDGYYDDIMNNRVVVELKNYSEEVIDNFKKNVTDSPLIHFTSSRNITDYITTYSPGQGILPLGCSIGFRAKLGSAIGFVTAGHCVSEVNQTVPTFGVVKKRRLSGNIDASWIDLDPLYSIGTAIKYHPQDGLPWSLDNTPVKNFVVGQLYGKSGVSSQYTYGKITSLSASGANGITGLVDSTIYAKEGDSGGIVFKILGTGTDPLSYQTAGIVHGGPKGGGNMKFVRANDIVSIFSLTTY